MKSMMFLLLPAALAFGTVSSPPVRAADDPQTDSAAVADRFEPAPAKDLKLIQGIWVRKESAGFFRSRRIVKEVEGDRETVTYYDTRGQVERAHTAKVDLRRAGPLKIFAFSDHKITAGGNAGTETGYAAAYYYKVVGNTFIEIWGVISDKDEEIEVMRWKREGPAPEQRSDEEAESSSSEESVDT